MDYTIYTVGSAEFMGAILNGVAMLTTSTSFAKLISIGLLFGVLFVCWECVFSGTQHFNIHHMLIALIAYMCMFGPTRTVVVQDVYNNTSTDIVVDNIPLGVAASGTIISKIGYNIAVLIETAYHPVSTVATVYQGGYIEPLRIINSLREFNYSPRVYEEINKKLGSYTPYLSGRSVPSDFKSAVINYQKDCINPAIGWGQLSTNTIETANQPIMEVLKSSNKALYTYLPIANVSTTSSGDPQAFRCDEAYTTLKAIMDDVTSDNGVWAAVGKNLGGAATKNGDGGINTQTIVDGSLSSIGLVGAKSQELMAKSIAREAFHLASIGYYKNNQDTASAIAVSQAIEKRNIQWASEGSMFYNSVRALMTFIEGFVYAIMPVMAFIFVMGAIGMRVVGRYMQIIAWIQLWYPILAICNMFIVIGMKNAVSEYSSFQSYYAIDRIYNSTLDWMGVGGMMTAATPMLALLIISGSSMAFTAVAGRLGGQDHFDEKLLAPDVSTVAPVMQTNAVGNYDSVHGAQRVGGASLIPNLNSKTDLGSGEVAARAKVESTSADVSKSFSGFVSAGGQLSNQAQVMENIGKNVVSQLGRSAGDAVDYLSSLGHNVGTRDNINYQQMGELAAKGSLGISIKKFGAGMSATVKDATSQSRTFDSGTSTSGADALRLTQQINSSFQKGVSTGVTESVTDTASLSKGDGKERRLADSISAHRQAQDNYTKTTSLLSSIGTSRSIDGAAAIQAIAHNASAEMANLRNAINWSPEHKAGVEESARAVGIAQLDDKTTPIAQLHYAMQSGDATLMGMAANVMSKAGFVEYKNPQMPDDHIHGTSVNAAKLYQEGSAVRNDASKLTSVSPQAAQKIHDSSSRIKPIATGNTSDLVRNPDTQNDANAELIRVAGIADNYSQTRNEFLNTHQPDLLKSGDELSTIMRAGKWVQNNTVTGTPEYIASKAESLHMTSGEKALVRMSAMGVSYTRLSSIKRQMREENARMYDRALGVVDQTDASAVQERADLVNHVTEAKFAQILHGNLNNRSSFAKVEAFNTQLDRMANNGENTTFEQSALSATAQATVNQITATHKFLSIKVPLPDWNSDK